MNWLGVTGKANNKTPRHTVRQPTPAELAPSRAPAPFTRCVGDNRDASLLGI